MTQTAPGPRKHRRRETVGEARRRAQRLASTGETERAVAALMAASGGAPEDGTLHAEIASLLCDLGRCCEAVGAGLMAVELAPGSARAQAELARALFLAGDVEAARRPSTRAIMLAPRKLGAMVTHSAILFTLGDHDAALDWASKAVGQNPGHAHARANLALALEATGRLDGAEAQSRAALAIEPTGSAARHNLAGLLLSRGKLGPEAWALYDARLGLNPLARALEQIPRWRGEEVSGRTVLLHAEQGLGDMIQFVRYAALLKARGAHVVLAVPGSLLRLMQDVAGVDQVVRVGGALPRHDVFCPVASLPGAFGTTLDSIPAPIPYLFARPDAAERFRPQPTGRHQVGLVWAGNPDFVHDRLRSVDPAVFRELDGLDGVDFHSLQKDGNPPFPMQDRMAEMADLADTAGLVAGLDLVITVDTAVAHLAGAMGRPVWMLSRFMGCWRWMRDRDDSPWYPSMRIFRQGASRDWTGVVGQVRSALERRLSAGMPPGSPHLPPQPAPSMPL